LNRSFRMRILVLATSFPSNVYPHSGIFIRRLLERLPKDIFITVLTPDLDQPGEFRGYGNRLVVRAFRYAPRPWQTLAHGEGGIPVALRRRPWQWALVPVFCMVMFVQTLKFARCADLIHAHWSVCGVIAGAAGRLMGKPVMTTLRGTDVSAAEKSLLFRWAIRCCGIFSDHMVAVGQAMARRIAGWLPGKRDKIAVIANGVGDSFRDKTQIGARQPFTVGVIGHLIALKNVDGVVRAFADLAGKRVARLIVVGDGPERAPLEALARRLGQGDRVTFTGAIPPAAVPEILSHCNALVLASRSEGRPNVVLEAMAAGVPVVASDIDGVREMIVHGERGLLFPVGDERRLAAHLRRLMDDPDLAQWLAANARQWVDDQGLTWENAARRYAVLYHDVIRRRRRQ
jgi:glycosyltransferase involved in cell wall biosynthesis